MLGVHPFGRLLCGCVFIVAVFLAPSLTKLAWVYTVICVAVLLTQTVYSHIRFVLLVGLPLLVALLLVWALAADPARIPAPHSSGVELAVFNWLRIIGCAGVLQALFHPLVEHPLWLKDFLRRAGMPQALSTIIVASLVFLPEVRRRLSAVIDARKAQGHALSGLRGILQLPTLLVPLVASLLTSATKRAEFWEHRGILQDARAMTGGFTYSRSQTASALALGALTLIVARFT